MGIAASIVAPAVTLVSCGSTSSGSAKNNDAWLKKNTTYVAKTKTLTIKEGVTSIPDDAFMAKYPISTNPFTVVNLPASLTTIGNAFGSIKDNQPTGYDIETIHFGKNIKTIGEYAFIGAIQLKSLNIPASVTSIGNYAFASALSNWRAAKLTFSQGSKLVNIGNLAFEGSKILELKLPNSVKSIGDGAFLQSWFESGLTLPDNVTSVGKEAFWNIINAPATVVTTLRANKYINSDTTRNKIFRTSDKITFKEI